MEEHSEFEVSRAKLFLLEFRDVEFVYEDLLEDEKGTVTKEIFEKLICYSWYLVEQNDIDWLSNEYFNLNHVARVKEMLERQFPKQNPTLN